LLLVLCTVRALLPLRQLMLSSSSLEWRGWWRANSSMVVTHHTQHMTDPCGQPLCGRGMPVECAWQGLSCNKGRIVGL
jgi:hypothetical protein